MMKQTTALDDVPTEQDSDYLAGSLYVHATFKPETTEKLYAWAQSLADVPNLVVPTKYHCTIVYSREPVEGWKSKGNIAPTIFVPPLSYKLEFLGAPGKPRCLVLRFDSAFCRSRHERAEDLGASYDFPEYIPHVTISYNCPNLDLSVIPLPKFPLWINGEYDEEIFIGDYSSQSTKAAVEAAQDLTKSQIASFTHLRSQELVRHFVRSQLENDMHSTIMGRVLAEGRLPEGAELRVLTEIARGPRKRVLIPGKIKDQQKKAKKASDGGDSDAGDAIDYDKIKSVNDLPDDHFFKVLNQEGRKQYIADHPDGKLAALYKRSGGTDSGQHEPEPMTDEQKIDHEHKQAQEEEKKKLDGGPDSDPHPDETKEQKPKKAKPSGDRTGPTDNHGNPIPKHDQDGTIRYRPGPVEKPSPEEYDAGFKRTAKQFGLDAGDLKEAYKRVEKPEVMTDNIWEKLENTHSYDMDTWGDADHYAGKIKQDLTPHKEAIKAGKALPAPVVLTDRGKKRFVLVGGEGQLTAMRAAGVLPNVIMLEVPKLQGKALEPTHKLSRKRHGLPDLENNPFEDEPEKKQAEPEKDEEEQEQPEDKKDAEYKSDVWPDGEPKADEYNDDVDGKIDYLRDLQEYITEAMSKSHGDHAKNKKRLDKVRARLDKLIEKNKKDSNKKSKPTEEESPTDYDGNPIPLGVDDHGHKRWRAAHFQATPKIDPDAGWVKKIKKQMPNLNLDVLNEGMKNSQIEDLDNKTWDNVVNTDSYDTDDWDDVWNVAKKKGIKMKPLREAVWRGDPIPPPVILTNKARNKFHLLSGDGSLMAMRASGVHPRAHFVEMPDDTFKDATADEPVFHKTKQRFSEKEIADMDGKSWAHHIGRRVKKGIKGHLKSHKKGVSAVGKWLVHGGDAMTPGEKAHAKRFLSIFALTACAVLMAMHPGLIASGWKVAHHFVEWFMAKGREEAKFTLAADEDVMSHDEVLNGLNDKFQKFFQEYIKNKGDDNG